MAIRRHDSGWGYAEAEYEAVYVLSEGSANLGGVRMFNDKTVKVEFEDYILLDKLNALAIEYALAVDRLINISIRRLIDDVEFVRGLRKDESISATRQDEQK